MNKEYTDNEIAEILGRVSNELSPSAQSFDVLLQKLQPEQIQAPAYTSKQSPRILTPKTSFVSPYGSVLKIASACMAVLVVYIGISNIPTKNTVSDTFSSKTGSNIESENTSTNAFESMTTGKVASPEKAVALLQKNSTPSEVTELGSALENELLAEVEANTDLFAISDSL